MADAPASITPMTVIEAHLFAYLGCILGLFRGQAIRDWGYAFAVTSEGFPFSVQFEAARSIAVAQGLVDEDKSGMMVGRRSRLSDEMDVLLTFGPWSDRRLWLRAATECALALPLGSVRHAISQTPGMGASVRLGQRRLLLQQDDIELIYDEYQVVRSVLGEDAHDLLSPAVIWLSARILRIEDKSVD